MEDLNFITPACCFLLETLYDLLEIENALISTEKTSFEVSNILGGVSFCFLVLNDLPFETTDGFGRTQVGFVILL